MVNKLFHRLLLAFAMIGTGATAIGQDLHTEVEIRYRENPQLRDFSKPVLNPTVTLPALRTRTMPYSRGADITVPGSIDVLAPVAYADSIYTSPYRGYAMAGFMPRFNLEASAGYKILDTDHTRLNAWMQYDGTLYHGTTLASQLDGSGRESCVRRQTATVGASLHQAAGRESFIDAGLDYTFARYSTMPIHGHDRQNTHRLNMSLLWNVTHGGIRYGLGAEVNHFAYVDRAGYTYPLYQPEAYVSKTPVPRPAREWRLKAGGFFQGRFAGASSAGVEFAVTHFDYNNNYSAFILYPALAQTVPGLPEPVGEIYSMVRSPRKNPTLLHLHPFYRFGIEQLRLDLGVNLDFRFNQQAVFHISPQAQATWIPADVVKVYVKATGGQYENNLGSLFDVNPYAFPYTSYGFSSIPVEAEAGVNIGIYKGFSMGISASFGFADDWLMPVSYNWNSTPVSKFDAYNFKSLKIHAEIGYTYRNIFSARATFDAAPQKEKRGYYLWRDRAKTVVTAEACVSPIRPLDITVGWEYRGGRATTSYWLTDEPQPLPVTIMQPLRSVNNLTAGALYRITPQWSAFVRGENLMNRHHYLIGGMPSQGITGLVGATYKF